MENRADIKNKNKKFPTYVLTKKSTLACEAWLDLVSRAYFDLIARERNGARPCTLVELQVYT